jgi:hypothetical protein
MDQTQERAKAGRGNDGLLESLEKTVRLFFPPFPQTLEIDVADFHITTATETTGMNIPKRSCRQALRFAPSGLRSGHASNNDKRKERNKFQQLSGIMVVADRKD